MEYMWYILAALGAGIGPGLAGLSAATVMVPILIVLCPSFSGETGAYQATAIAFASDILGSTAGTKGYKPRIFVQDEHENNPQNMIEYDYFHANFFMPPNGRM